jgi:hypothetical protein
MTDKTIRVQTESWMKPVENKDGLTAFLIGYVKDLPHTQAVAIQGTGATRFYCQEHQRIYPVMENCPDCALVYLPQS